jgi:hypothetical protein
MYPTILNATPPTPRASTSRNGYGAVYESASAMTENTIARYATRYRSQIHTYFHGMRRCSSNTIQIAIAAIGVTTCSRVEFESPSKTAGDEPGISGPRTTL